MCGSRDLWVLRIVFDQMTDVYRIVANYSFLMKFKNRSTSRERCSVALSLLCCYCCWLHLVVLLSPLSAAVLSVCCAVLCCALLCAVLCSALLCSALCALLSLSLCVCALLYKNKNQRLQSRTTTTAGTSGPCGRFFVGPLEKLYIHTRISI